MALSPGRARDPRHPHRGARRRAYAFGIARDHPFPDGNKLVALTLAGVFLERNGWRLGAPEAESAGMTIALAAGDVDEAAYADWLRSSSAKRRSRRRP